MTHSATESAKLFKLLLFLQINLTYIVRIIKVKS